MSDSQDQGYSGGTCELDAQLEREPIPIYRHGLIDTTSIDRWYIAADCIEQRYGITIQGFKVCRCMSSTEHEYRPPNLLTQLAQLAVSAAILRGG